MAATTDDDADETGGGGITEDVTFVVLDDELEEPGAP